MVMGEFGAEEREDGYGFVVVIWFSAGSLRRRERRPWRGLIDGSELQVKGS
jgi:hypothetical protein